MVMIIKKGASIEDIKKRLTQFKSKKAFNAHRHNGVIKLKESPLEIQKKMRDEWE